MPFLLLAFLIVPIAEIYVLIQVGGEIGAPGTIALVVLTALVGAALMRSQGLAAITRIRNEMQRGEPPALALVEGAMILFAGALLLTPGFITDTVGFLCLTPPVRAWMAQRIIAGAVAHVASGARVDIGPGGGPFRSRDRVRRGTGVIDGEYSREGDDGATGEPSARARKDGRDDADGGGGPAASS